MKYLFFCLWIFALSFSLFAFLGYVLSIKGQQQLAEYKSVPAVISTSEIVKTIKYSENNTSGPRTSDLYWFIDIQFEYVIDGESFTAKEISNNSSKYSRYALVSKHESPPEYMRQYLSSYPLGKEVIARVNPKRKDGAYLEIRENLATPLRNAFIAFAILALIFFGLNRKF